MRYRNSAAVLLLANLQPAPAAPPAGSSIAVWLWIGVALALVVVVGYVLSSRR